MLRADQPLERPLFLSVKELLVDSLIQSNANVRSAIVNCICPECGGAIELDSSEFRCVGRCGKDWRPIWRANIAIASKHVDAIAIGNFARAGGDSLCENNAGSTTKSPRRESAFFRGSVK